MANLINDTLRPKGKYELKRIAAVTAFYFSVMYAFMPVFISDFEVQEFVFWGFITYSASCVGMQVWNKKIDNRLDRYEDFGSNGMEPPFEQPPRQPSL